MTENNFATLYKTWTTDKLLDIVDNPEDYQILAVEAARLELGSRQLTQEQLSEAKAEQSLRRSDKASKQQKVKDIEGKVKSVGSSLVDTFNPIQRDAPSTDKFIKLISLFLGALFLYQLYKEFHLLWFMITDDSDDWDISMVFYFLPMILLATAALLLWFKKKLGWTLATLFFSYTAVGTIPLFLSALNRHPTGTALDTIFPVVSPTVYVGTFLFFGGATWAMTKESIREVYNISLSTMVITICLGAAIVLLVTLAIG